MTENNQNSTCNILCWVIAISVGLIVFFLTRPGMALILALILGVVVGALVLWLLKSYFCKEDAPASVAEEAAPTPAAPTPSEPEVVEEPAPAAEEVAPEPAPAPEAPVPAAEPAEEAAPAATAQSDSPEVLGAPRGGVADDLKKIKGVGPGLEKTLNELGIFHFDQIAAWTAADIEWVDARLKFKGRITRDDWVSQAKDMVG